MSAVPMLAAQNVAVTAQPATRELQRVTVNVRNTPLPAVLQNIAHQAGLIPAYDDAMLPPKSRITINVRDVAADVAFQQALQGTGLVARIHPGGDVVIVKAASAVDDGVIAGKVVDGTTKRPIPGVRISIDGTKITGTTNERGEFRIHGVPDGDMKVTFRRLGYRGASAVANTGSKGSLALVIELTSTPTELTKVVTTAAGERSRLEVGNSVGVIKADSVVQTALVRNVSDLLTARTPGVVVQNASGLVGSPSRIRIRGLNSLQLNNDPIIVIDGVRIASQTTVAASQTNTTDVTVPGNQASGVASTSPLAPSRLDDIDPNSIETIEVLRGPSAAAQYGPDASNGVILIKTKRAKVGPWKLSVSGDQGWQRQAGDQVRYWYAWDHNVQSGGYPYSGCTLARLPGDYGGYYSVEAGTCTIDSVTSYAPKADPRVSNLGTGDRKSLSTSLSGGTAQLRQSFTVSYSDVVGMLKMSAVQQALINNLWTHPAPSWMEHPNTESSYNVSSQTALGGAAEQKWDAALSLSGSYRNLLTARPNGFSGIVSQTGKADSLSWLPSQYQRERVTSTGTRGFGGLSANYAATTWLHFSLTGGGDYGLESGESLLRAIDCTPGYDTDDVNGAQVCPSGRTVRRRQTFERSVTGNATLTTNPLSWLRSETFMSENYNKVDTYALQASSGSGTDLAFGSNLLVPYPTTRYGGNPVDVDEQTDATASVGWSVNEMIALRGTMFFTSGYQRTVSSAIGAAVNKRPPFYPKINGSWLLSEEPFFPKNRIVPTLRLRGAYGRSGQQPGQAAILGGYSQGTALDSIRSLIGLQLTSAGNPALRPEKTTDAEFGFDGALFGNERVTFGASGYRKHTDDAIVSTPLPESYGIDNLSKTVNVGTIENKGLEFETTIRLLERRGLAWNLSVQASRNTNKLLYKDPSFPSTGRADGNAYTVGYPLNGYWGYPVLSYDDVNGDGYLERTELILGPVSYMGSAQPQATMNYSTNIVIGPLSFNMNFDERYKQSILQNAWGSTTGPRGLIDKTTSLAEQAAAIQAFYQGGYVSAYTSVRFNEASVAYSVPSRIARRWLHTESASIAVSGRNLALWTNYSGNDPNIDIAGQFSEQPSDNGTGLAQPREWTLRFHLGF